MCKLLPNPAMHFELGAFHKQFNRNRRSLEDIVDYHDALAALESDQDGIAGYRAMHAERLDLLVGLMREAGMKPPIAPKAGVYTLWETPTRGLRAACRECRRLQLHHDRADRGRGCALRCLPALRLLCRRRRDPRRARRRIRRRGGVLRLTPSRPGTYFEL
ncbi:MAG: hypothetical protein RIM84_21595 [Alphaproteobacteria bacterium]